MKRIITAALCLTLFLGLSTVAAGCSRKEEPSPTTAALTEGAVYGQGTRYFTFSAENLSGKAVTVSIKTDKETVGDALLELGIIEGENSNLGLYVQTVNNITLDYDKDGKYWAFYINGEIVLTGIDTTEIQNGSIYALCPEQ